MGNSVSVDAAVSPPREYDSGDDEKIPFVADGMISATGPSGTAMRVRAKYGRIAGVDVAVCQTIRIMRTDQGQLERNKEEARKVAAKLSQTRHHHILRTIATYFYNSHNSLQFSIVVDYVKESLRDYLAPSTSEGPSRDLPRPEWFGCLINVVAFLHGRGISHRAISPESILVRNGDSVLLSNFDVSQLDAWKTQRTTLDAKWGRWKTTATGRYGAPEIQEEPSRGRATDVFSLGAVFLEMLLVRHDRHRSSPNDSKPKMEELENILSLLNKTGATSYALSAHAIRSWLRGLTLLSPSATAAEPSWETEVLDLCRQMLEPERDARPRADELSSKWTSVARAYASTENLMCDECSRGQQNVSGDMMAPSTPGRLKRTFTWSSIADVDTVAADAVSVGTQDKPPGETDLFRAAGRGNMGDAKNVLARGDCSTAVVDAKNTEGWSALHYAAKMNHPDIVALLLDKKASLELFDNAGWTALHFAAWEGHEDVLKELLSRGANFRAVDKNGNTALHLAAEGGHDKVVDLLLKKMDKADVNRNTNQGHSALWLAASGGHRDAVRLMVACDKVDIRAPTR